MLSGNQLSRAREAAWETALGRAALAISAVALATAGLAACSSSSAPSAGSSTAVGTSASPAASGVAGAGSGPNVCAILTTSRVASITGEPVGPVTRGRAGVSSTCSYSLSHGASGIEVEVSPRSSPAGYSGFSGLVTAGASPPGSAISEPGLGQHALASSFGVAVQGARYTYLVLNAHGQVSNPLGSDLKMARILVGALG